MKLTFAAAVIGALMFTQPAAAGPIVGDREWRPLTETTGFSWLMVNAVCGTGVCHGDLGGVSVDGWYWADNSDLQALFDELIQPGTTQFPTPTTNYVNANDADIAGVLDSVFAPTTEFFGFREARGFSRTKIDDFNAYLAYFYDSPFANQDDMAVLDSPVPTNFGHSSMGVWLYKPVQEVPEPVTLALLGTALAGVASRRLRRARRA